MPARQPPRPAPRASGKSGGARGGAKGGAKPGAKGGAKPGARKAAPSATARSRQAAARQKTEQQQRQRVMFDQQRRQREANWWAVNQVAMNRLHATQHHAAGGEAIGTVLNGDRRLRWRTSHAVGAITLLILSAFFTSMALGSQSIGIAVLAFMCFAGCVAFITVELSARRFPQPVPAPPLIGEHRLEDLIVEDDPPSPKDPSQTAPGTIDALEDLLGHEAPGAEPPTGEQGAAVEDHGNGREAPPAASPPGPSPDVAAAESAAAAATETPARAETENDESDVAPPQAVATIDPETEQPAAEAPEGPEPIVAAEPVEPGPAAAPVSPAVEVPMPPRQRTSPESMGETPAELTAMLLGEQAMGGTDVSDVAATLIVADLDRAVEFYTEALGLAIVDRTGEAAVLEAGFGKVLLWERPDAPPGETGVMHLTFEVGDLEATFTKMNDAGVEFLHLPRTALLGQGYELRAASFRDPDGHGLAITEHRER